MNIQLSGLIIYEPGISEIPKTSGNVNNTKCTKGIKTGVYLTEVDCDRNYVTEKFG